MKPIIINVKLYPKAKFAPCKRKTIKDGLGISSGITKGCHCTGLLKLQGRWTDGCFYDTVEKVLYIFY